MSTGERSASPQPRDVDVDMDKPSEDKPDAKVVVITNLTRNVVEAHLQSIFGFYGEIAKIDLPIYVKCAYHIHATFDLGRLVVFLCSNILLFLFSLSRSK
jgi:hypothetical protein